MSFALTTMLAQTGSGSPNPSASINSVFDFLIKGGPIMIPIGLCSLVALTVIIERMITLRRSRVIPPKLVASVRSKLEEGGADAALAFCGENSGTLANVLAAAIKRLHDPEEVRDRHIQEAGEREAIKLRKNLRVLSVIGSVAPLLGLLGTITGMIKAFQTVAASGEALGRTELLARGIYEAMITTAAGLIVAIPVVVCYHWLAAKVDTLVMQIDGLTMDFIEDQHGPEKSRSSHEATGNGHVAHDPERRAAELHQSMNT